MEEKKEEQFRVVDRRRFSSEGKSQFESNEKRDQSPSGIEAKEESEPNTQNQHQEIDPQNMPALDFSGFVVGLATQALVLLGEVPDPESGVIVKNLDAAKQTIDILCLLKDKTKGNLNQSEERLMTEVVSTMQLKYVQACGIK